MTKKIKNRQLSEIVNALSFIDYKTKNKNLFIVRCEKLLKKLSEIGKDVNAELQDIREEFAETDEKGRFIYETVNITDKNGTSKTENSGVFKYTHQRAKKRDEAIEKKWDEEVEIPIYLISRDEKNISLYKSIFKDYSLTMITAFAEIILDVPLDAERFIDEEFVLEMTKEEDSSKQNEQAQKEENISVNG